MKKIIFSSNFKFILFFSISIVLLHNKSYNKLPSKIHGWAQGDHYVLALGFLENDFDFFHPTTYALTHQFKPKEKLENPQGITAVDFPIFHYTVAGVMSVLRTTEPWVYRLVMLLWSFIALFYLFRTIVLIKGFWEALFITGFILLQPIYAYYQNGFHVSAAAFNSFLIGLSFLLRYLYFSKNKYYIFGVLFLTLAALMRFTQVIFLLAILGIFFMSLLKNKKINWKVLYIFLSLFFVASYFIYNKYLANTHGSVFLNKPLIADSFGSFFHYLFNQIKKYSRSFLPMIHFTGIVILIYLFLTNKIKKEIKLTPLKIGLLFSVLGVGMFNILMPSSMSAHDYYALDTWLPVLVLTICFIVLQLDFTNKYITIIVVIFLSGALSLATETQYWKYKYLQTNGDVIVNDFKESNVFLNSFDVENNKTIVICANGWNTPMLAWHKKVHRVATNFKEEIPAIFTNNFDLIITHNVSYDDLVLNNMPNFEKFAVKIKTNDKLTVWKPKLK